MAKKIEKITPFLWFNDNAEEAVNFYISLFKKSKILQITHYPEGTPGKPGSVMTVSFELAGKRFTALNGGPLYHFTEAISFVVNCDDQREIDYLWKKLSKRGSEMQCGWLKDRFGLSWQIVPSNLTKLLSGKNGSKPGTVMRELLKMKKLDLNILERAHRRMD